jgi:hypothetical protein
MGRKTMSKFICAFLLTWILARGLSAQEDRSWDDWHRQQVEEVVAPALDLTSHLTAYIAYAQLYNPSIEAALARWRSALGKVAPAFMGGSASERGAFCTFGRDARRTPGAALGADAGYTLV